MQASTMQARMKNPVMVIPEALQPLLNVGEAARKIGLPGNVAEMVHLRAAQINGCGYCVDMHSRALREAGEADERIFSVAAWRDAPFYTESERAALALTEAATRLSDRPDPVPDEAWEEAARHYEEQALASLILEIALINFWNRLTVTIRQPAGQGAG